MAFSKARRLANLMSSASDTVPAAKVNTVIADDAIGVDQIANSINTAITANTAKVTNAITTHTGDVTGGAALTIAVDAVDIPMLSASGTANNTTFLRGDNAWASVPAGVDIQSSVPSVASEGSLYYNSTLDILYLSNGTAWLQVVANSAPVAAGGTVTIPAANNNSTFNYNVGAQFTDAETSDPYLAYSVGGGTAPPGMVMPNTGSSTLIGTATTPGTFTFTIKATDASGAFASQAYTQVINPTVIATGGTTTTTGGYKYHTFTSSGTFAVTAGANLTVDAAIVAGGGAGGGSTAGGGGAGGFIESNSYTVAVQNYTITIGAGAGPGISTQLSTSGSNTVALGSTAIGGGGGSTSTNNSYTQHAGLSGGSGGGGAHYHVTGAPGAGTAGQGNSGGVANGYSGAGGGKGAVGGAGNAQYNGAGGVGLNWKSLGTYYAGGGGAENGLGGLGGGGRGISVTGQPAHPNGESGAANTGGGGGTCWGYVSHNGGAGGSGIVVIRYAV